MAGGTSAEPDLRILQANERTLLAWVRTGLALMAFGFVVARLSVWLGVENERVDGAPGLWLGIGFVALGTTCHIVGAVRFVLARRAIVSGRAIEPGAAGPVAVATLVSALGIAAIGYLAMTG